MVDDEYIKYMRCIAEYQAILDSSVLSLSILERREQSRNYEPAKIWRPPRMAGSTS